MITKIINRLNVKNENQDVEVGQVRTNECGRVIMVIRVLDRNSGYLGEGDLKAMILEEMVRCNGGKGVPFRTMPKVYTVKEMTDDYPILLNSTITIDKI